MNYGRRTSEGEKRKEGESVSGFKKEARDEEGEKRNATNLSTSNLLSSLVGRLSVHLEELGGIVLGGLEN